MAYFKGCGEAGVVAGSVLISNLVLCWSETQKRKRRHRGCTVTREELGLRR